MVLYLKLNDYFCGVAEILLKDSFGNVDPLQGSVVHPVDLTEVREALQGSKNHKFSRSESISSKRSLFFA